MKKLLPLHEMAESFDLVSKLIDDIACELAGRMKIQQLQNLLAKAWKPYMKNLDTMYTDATCYESEMRYPTDQKLLRECCEKAYKAMCEVGSRLLLIFRSVSLFLSLL